jgi:hypothetical protein
MGSRGEVILNAIAKIFREIAAGTSPVKSLKNGPSLALQVNTRRAMS